MVEAEFKEIQKLLKPNSRRQVEAKSKLKFIAIVEASLEGVRSQSGEFELRKMVREVKDGKFWQDIFPGVASLQLETTGTGINVDIRITKKEGEAVHLVPEGTPGATVLAVKRVNELDYYNLGAKKLAEKVRRAKFAVANPGGPEQRRDGMVAQADWVVRVESIEKPEALADRKPCRFPRGLANKFRQGSRRVRIHHFRSKAMKRPGFRSAHTTAFFVVGPTSLHR